MNPIHSSTSETTFDRTSPRSADHALDETALPEGEERFRRLIELLPNAVAVHCDGEIVFVNPAAVALMRADSESQLLGTSIFDIMHPSSRARVVARIRHAQATWQNPSLAEERFVTCTGEEIETEVMAIPLMYGGKPAMMVIVRETTDLKRAEEENRKLERQLRHGQKLESLGVLAGGVAHDFNNILMAIQGNIDLALDDLPASSPARGSLVAALAAARRAADLARQMLAYSGKGRFVVAALDLNEVVEETARVFETSISDKIFVTFARKPDLPSVDVDAVQIRQVVTNLVLNAAEAIGDAPGEISMATDVVACDRARLASTWVDDRLPAGDYVSLAVRDSGQGMDAETLARIFDPFFSTKFTGRGLGLAAVLGIVRGHRGAIEVHSAPGEGSRFTILLPVSQPAEPGN